MGLKVIVTGDGIGGLALAQGLRLDRVDVVVHERDRSPSHRLQGYRAHINEDGSPRATAPRTLNAIPPSAAAPSDDEEPIVAALCITASSNDTQYDPTVLTTSGATPRRRKPQRTPVA